MRLVMCDECGEMVEVESGGEDVCPNCGHFVENWGDVLPVRGEVSPAECADYATHPAQVVEDEAEDARRFTGTKRCLDCRYLSPDCTPPDNDSRCFGFEQAVLWTPSVVAIAADEEQEAHIIARQTARITRQDAYAAFEAVAGAAEWQPSAEAKQLISKLQGGIE